MKWSKKLNSSINWPSRLINQLCVGDSNYLYSAQESDETVWVCVPYYSSSSSLALHPSMRFGLLNNSTPFLSVLSNNLPSSDLHGSQAVSYTHLDVYKRQTDLSADLNYIQPAGFKSWAEQSELGQSAANIKTGHVILLPHRRRHFVCLWTCSHCVFLCPTGIKCWFDVSWKLRCWGHFLGEIGDTLARLS